MACSNSEPLREEFDMFIAALKEGMDKYPTAEKPLMVIFSIVTRTRNAIFGEDPCQTT